MSVVDESTGTLGAVPTPVAADPASGVRQAPSALVTAGSAARPEVSEPVLDVDEIQGNILTGFNKDHVTLVFLRIVDPVAFKAWLRAFAANVATAAEVVAFNRLFKATGQRRGRHGTVKATWLNIAFTAEGLGQLTDISAFTDPAFHSGPTAPLLGDPTAEDAEGNIKNWVIGGTHTSFDVLITVASDDRLDLADAVSELEDSVFCFRPQPGARPVPSGASVVFKQHGATQPGAMAGHEHFGFLDGVSQPGLRGLLSPDNTDVLTLRQNPGDPQQGKPGQDLLWPGEFVFGYPKQDPTKDDITAQGPDSLAPAGTPVAPQWARNGAYLVFRRLRQDVGAFHQFLNDTYPKVAATSAGELGARMVGRWASGAPVIRTPQADNAALGGDDCANNHFEFQSPSTALSSTDDLECSDDTYPQSPGDPAGALCPFNSHIRKSYPRDDTAITPPSVPSAGYGPPTDGTPVRVLGEPDTQTHRLLRRGIPYGASSTSRPDAPLHDATDRGLLFFAYMTSITDQFEFVMGSWVNNTEFKEPGTGLDLVLGQRADGSHPLNLGGAPIAPEPGAWITTTGSGYLFAPSLHALQHELVAE